jgi:hypothetical protein
MQMEVLSDFAKALLAPRQCMIYHSLTHIIPDKV